MVSNMVRINDMLVRQIIGDKIDEIWRYTMRYMKRMCTGDHHCEYVIEQKK